jgi:hypothetical protein
MAHFGRFGGAPHIPALRKRLPSVPFRNCVCQHRVSSPEGRFNFSPGNALGNAVQITLISPERAFQCQSAIAGCIACALSGLRFGLRCKPRALPWARVGARRWRSEHWHALWRMTQYRSPDERRIHDGRSPAARPAPRYPGPRLPLCEGVSRISRRRGGAGAVVPGTSLIRATN